MNPVIMHIWGPLSIHMYGTCIAIGIIIGLWLLHNDTKVSKIISPNDASNLVTLMITSGYLGGRILYMITDHSSIGDFAFLVQFWEPGLSIMGCIIAIAITTIAFLHSKKIPLLQLMDRLAIYSPLVQSFGRLGCFFTGCCYGISTNVWWAVTYNHPENMAPLCTPLHPTQLYSSILLFGIFIYLYKYGQYIFKKQGSVLIQYLILVSTERFIVDFLRWDRTWWSETGFTAWFSTNQWVALTVIALCGAWLSAHYCCKKKYGS